MENPKNSPQLSALLQAVSGKLGVAPDVLRAQLEAGKFDSAIAGMNPKEQSVFQQLLADPKRLSQIMSTRQAKALYDKLTKSP